MWSKGFKTLAIKSKNPSCLCVKCCNTSSTSGRFKSLLKIPLLSTRIWLSATCTGFCQDLTCLSRIENKADRHHILGFSIQSSPFNTSGYCSRAWMAWPWGTQFIHHKLLDVTQWGACSFLCFWPNSSGLLRVWKILDGLWVEARVWHYLTWLFDTEVEFWFPFLSELHGDTVGRYLQGVRRELLGRDLKVAEELQVVQRFATSYPWICVKNLFFFFLLNIFRVLVPCKNNLMGSDWHEFHWFGLFWKTIKWDQIIGCFAIKNQWQVLEKLQTYAVDQRQLRCSIQTAIMSIVCTKHHQRVG